MAETRIIYVKNKNGTTYVCEDTAFWNKEKKMPYHKRKTIGDADFIVKVIDVYPDDFSWQSELGLDRQGRKIGVPDSPALQVPDYIMAGYQLMVRGEIMRGKYRESFSNPEPFEPGKTTIVKFTMPDVSHTQNP